ncbi:hypothetical protein C9374_011638 [Naegleria lovaniensis]|uniref:Uncharacterized protein n=1 Tax=Naegleria lovaniensis TaxID=51637 RepID=A0AA88GF02_NAELO|nr:uncharacterized protein C9374_011638 [Naegleria lovaniensis]KAG2373973.1 hypothetical protein C9374_011638 [Naegleria lovaniensis]
MSLFAAAPSAAASSGRSSSSATNETKEKKNQQSSSSTTSKDSKKSSSSKNQESESESEDDESDFQLPQDPSLLFFEQVLSAFPRSLLCEMVEQTLRPRSKFDPYNEDFDVVVNQFIKHCIRAGLNILQESMDASLLNDLFLVFGSKVSDVHTIHYTSTRRELVTELWASKGFDFFLQSTPVEILHRFCECLNFREDTNDRVILMSALKEELFIAGCLLLMQNVRSSDLKNALTAIRDAFQELFSNYSFFEDAYCICSYFDSFAFALLILSLSFPHLRPKFKEYILNPNNEACKVLINSRATKTAESLKIPEIQVEPPKENNSSQENGSAATLESTTTIASSVSNGTITTTEEKKDLHHHEKLMETSENKDQTKKDDENKARMEQGIKEDSIEHESESDDSEKEEGEIEFPSSEGRPKIEFGVSSNDIYVNYTAKEIHDMCKFFKLKLKGNSRDRCKRIVKYLSGEIETKKKRKRQSTTSSGTSQKKKK